jgi:pimeloyl-ACP methyl ester carboxylesterase
MSFLRNIIFRPEKAPALEGVYGGSRFEPIVVTTSDGLQLVGLRSVPSIPSKYTILYLHGNGGCAAARAHFLAPMSKEGADIIVADYRGYGENSGEPTESGLMRDAFAFRNFALENSAGPIVVVGHSLGGALATILLAQDSSGFAGLITIGAFANLAARAPWFVRPFLPDSFDALSKVNHIDVPWYILHEKADQVVPVSHGFKLHEAATNKADVQLVILEGGNHALDHNKISPYVQNLLSRINNPQSRSLV